MYLSKIDIKNFRGIPSLTVQSHPGVNIIIGENNTGKTAIIDVLRLCLGFAQERRDLYLQQEDFYTGPDGVSTKVIELHLTFAEPTEREQGIFIEMLRITEEGPELQLHTRFTLDGDRFRRRYWGGDKEGQDIPHEVLELFYLTHLGSLRDATRDLTPSKGNQLSQLFLKLVDKEEDRNRYAKLINEQVGGVTEWKDLLANGEGKIEAHLNKVVLQQDSAGVNIQFVDATFRRVVEGLRMRLPRNRDDTKSNTAGKDSNNQPNTFEIQQNGLGQNNLIYIATVLGDLLERNSKEPDSFIALLIEEPEAHLHPQWQNVLFSYLREIGKRNIQVFISSHSPTISAKSDIDSLIVLTKKGESVISTPLRNIEISASQKNHLHRFLDVTKSQLFFARSVILVEGISEALLLPVFAKRMGESYNLEKNAVEIVNISGVAFEPFAGLFNSPEATKRISIRCALITDGDQRNGNDISARAAKAFQLKGGLLRVFLARETFEYELFLSNEDFIKRSYGELHSHTDFNFTGDEHLRAAEFAKKVNSNQDKGLFAQQLAAKIENDKSLNFVVPDYIQTAIKWAIDGLEPDSNRNAERNHL